MDEEEHQHHGVGASAGRARAGAGGGEVKTEETLRLRCEQLQGRVATTTRKLAEEHHQLAVAQKAYTELLRDKYRAAREKRRKAEAEARGAQEEEARIEKALEDASQAGAGEATMIPPPERRAPSREGDDGNNGQRQGGQGGSGSGSSSASAACALVDKSAKAADALAAKGQQGSLGKRARQEQQEASTSTDTDSEDLARPKQKQAAPATERPQVSASAPAPGGGLSRGGGGGGGGGGVGTADKPRSTRSRSKAKSATSRPDGDRVKHFLKSIEDWRYERRKGWWLKKAPGSVAHDISDDNAIVTMIEGDAPLLARFYSWEKQEMWAFLTEHCKVGVPCGSESKGWPCDGAAVVCPDKEIFAENKGVIARDELPSFMGRPASSRVRDGFNNWQKHRECQAEYW